MRKWSSQEIEGLLELYESGILVRKLRCPFAFLVYNCPFTFDFVGIKDSNLLVDFLARLIKIFVIRHNFSWFLLPAALVHWTRQYRALFQNFGNLLRNGAFRESNSGPLAPEARIIPLDQMPFNTSEL